MLQHQCEFHGGNRMPIPEIEEFAKILVQQVRDIAVRSCDIILEPAMRADIAKRWRDTGNADAIAAVVPDVIDQTVSALLQTIDQGLLRLKFIAVNGREIDLTEDGGGELAGWYMGTGGWRAMFSNSTLYRRFRRPLLQARPRVRSRLLSRASRTSRRGASRCGRGSGRGRRGCRRAPRRRRRRR